jgi:hypothetical protein
MKNAVIVAHPDPNSFTLAKAYGEVLGHRLAPVGRAARRVAFLPSHSPDLAAPDRSDCAAPAAARSAGPASAASGETGVAQVKDAQASRAS